MILLAQIFCCFFMTGLIWTIQVVHYPTFTHVGEAGFPAFHRFHSRQITWIVLPVMTVELVTAAYLAYAGPFTLNLIGVLLIWVATAGLSVPVHNRLATLYDPRAMRRLVTSNWVRTALWTARSGWWLVWLYATEAFRPG